MKPVKNSYFRPLGLAPHGSIAPALALVAAPVLAPLPARADDRRFTFVYEADTAAPGSVELEQYLTWKTRTREDHGFDVVEFRTEIELGLTDNLQLGLYLADWRYQDGAGVERDGVKYTDSAVELIYKLLDPVFDPLGLAAYGEFKMGDELIEVETKLIAQKNLGRFVLAYNLTLEASWEGQGYREREGELSQSLGVSFEINPRFLVGAEALHEIPLLDWHTSGAQTVFIGPNASYRAENWWITATPMIQATSVADEPLLQFRVIFGVSF